MAASRKATKNMHNAISSEQLPTKNLSIILSKDDRENKNVSTGTDQCMPGINISNNCISKLNNQNIEVTGLSKDSKLNPMRIKKLRLPVRSRYALFYNKSMLLTLLPLVAIYVTVTVNPVEYR
ncbi:Hypothetical predicted protein [Paramuricea clavata]|uniref:Uncharacterized protein n=1 Tax=Paramuricea clavata TaxID=317549 RepID=A0A6S7HDV9_PARCT|nr:Hypothetical predicted protein [Paramuricea clavata]